MRIATKKNDRGNVSLPGDGSKGSEAVGKGRVELQSMIREEELT